MKKRRNLLIIIIALVLAVALALTTVFVILPLFDKSEEEKQKVYSSGGGTVAWKTDSYGTFFMSATGLCYADEDKEVSMAEYRDVSSGVKSPIQEYGGENIVCVGDKAYYSKGVIYEIEFAKETYRKSAEWISSEDMENMNLSYGDYDLSSESYIYNVRNLQYFDGYIYYTKELAVSELKKGQVPGKSKEISIIGRINIEDKSVEIIKEVEETITGGIDYVVCDGWIYYSCGSLENLSLRKCRVDGTDETLLCEGYAYNLSVYDDKLYYNGESAHHISSINLDGSNRKTLVDAGEVIIDFTIDAENGTLYYIADDVVYSLSTDDQSVKKIMDVSTQVYHITCIDSKLYMMLSEPISWEIFDWGLAEEKDYGSKDLPMITGLCYDTKSKIARVAYTYMEDVTEWEVTRRYLWKEYNDEEFRIPYRDGYVTEFKFFE